RRSRRQAVERRISPNRQRAAEQNRIDAGVGHDERSVGSGVKNEDESTTPREHQGADRPEKQRHLALADPETPENGAKRRKREIEMLFDRERPETPGSLRHAGPISEGRADVEVVEDLRQNRRRRQRTGGEAEQRERGGQGERDVEGRENAKHSAKVEMA